MARATTVVPFDGAEHHAPAIARAVGGQLGTFDTRHFPDGETYLRFDGEAEGRDVVLVAALDRPDQRLLPVVLACATLRDLGAARVVLAAPYLPYLRQDRRFKPGEAVSAEYVGRLISREVDALVTVDPHLHRLPSLDAVFDVPSRAVAAAPALVEWIRENVERPILVGPDDEAEQWVRPAAEALDAPWVVFEKHRHGDRDVEVSGGDDARFAGYTPVLLDDIVSSGVTMVEAARRVRALSGTRPVCLAVHALFGDGAVAALEAEFSRVVTTDTVTHPSNAIPVATLIGAAVRQLLDSP